MASAFGAEFTALYVQTPLSESMSEQDRTRLRENISFAEQQGAYLVTVYGEDIASQIAEFVRVSGVTKIVLGRSNVSRRHFWNKAPLTEKLTDLVPSADIHIIPDMTLEKRRPMLGRFSLKQFIVYPRDFLIMLVVIALVTAIGLLFGYFGIDESTIMAIYILGVLLVALSTRGYTTSIICSFTSVLAFYFFFTEPKMSLHSFDSRYTVAFLIMLIISIVTGALATKLKDHAKVSAQSAFKTKVLFDTNQMLQKSKSETDIMNVTASQLMKLLDRAIVIYPEANGKIDKGLLYSDTTDTMNEDLFTSEEHETAKWVFENHHRAGRCTDRFPDAKCLYLALRIHTHVFGVVGVHIPARPLDYFENSILLSILGECSLAIENLRNEQEKERSAILAKNEQMRADFLRTFSHDLRTPLTSISGNASTLLANYDKLDDETRKQIFSDMYDDSQWLINLVENLLSVTRIEEGRMHLNLSVQLMEEVIDEAIRYIVRRKKSHDIKVEYIDDLLLAKVDAKLIIQVIINLVDNAIKYTAEGSHIVITARKKDSFVEVSVADDGEGIPDEIKPQIFEMFYTGNTSLADSRRSLGLGLFLCQSIVTAHGGTLTVTDNEPHGSVFTFTIPSSEVIQHE
ncbi:MAG: sensor histidine kinase KdpD [Clostridiales bacterium]|nr:sensor histidine kinase KdpD [Clostridiales bacterium]